jgi:hypothetical protein
MILAKQIRYDSLSVKTVLQLNRRLSLKPHSGSFTGRIKLRLGQNLERSAFEAKSLIIKDINPYFVMRKHR